MNAIDIVRIGANGERIITVQEQIAFLEPQYVRTILYASSILFIYSFYQYYTAENPKTWKNLKELVIYFSHTVALVMSIYLFIISLVYFYGGI